MKPARIRTPRVKPDERHLQLVPTPRRRRRRKIGRIFRPRHVPELLRYEEEIVLRVIGEMGGRVSLESIMKAHPERFNKKPLWWTLLRLASAKAISTSPDLARRLAYAGEGARRNIWLSKARAWFETYKPQSWREFWL